MTQKRDRHRPSSQAFDVWTRLVRAGKALRDGVEADLKEAMFPPLPWYDVLLELDRGPAEGLRQFELREKLLLAQYNLSRLIDRMAASGYVEKRPAAEDQRGHRLVATESGRALLSRMWPVYRVAVEGRLAGRLAPEEMETLTRLLERLYDRPEDSAKLPGQQGGAS